jgi:hypothetical protein
MKLPQWAVRCARAATTCTLLASLVACGGGRSNDSQTGFAGSESLRAAVERLEASGELPVLDRTDSIAGIDANANGVRDDIERYIEKKYTAPAQRKAAMQKARVFQEKLLVDKRDEAALDAVSYRGSVAIACSLPAFPGPEGAIQGSEMSRELESMTTNTKARLLAYLAYNKARSGSVSTMPREPNCD